MYAPYTRTALVSPFSHPRNISVLLRFKVDKTDGKYLIANHGAARRAPRPCGAAPHARAARSGSAARVESRRCPARVATASHGMPRSRRVGSERARARRRPPPAVRAGGLVGQGSDRGLRAGREKHEADAGRHAECRLLRLPARCAARAGRPALARCRTCGRQPLAELRSVWGSLPRAKMGGGRARAPKRRGWARRRARAVHRRAQGARRTARACGARSSMAASR